MTFNLNIVVDIVAYIIHYIFTIKLVEIPVLFFYIAIIGVVSYCGALILVGLPVSALKEIAKKTVNEKAEKKITTVIAFCLAVTFVFLLVYGEIT